MLVVRDAQAAGPGGPGSPPLPAGPGNGSDVVHGPLRNATTSGDACADRLWTLESGRGDATYLICGRHTRRCLLAIGGGITSLVRQCLSVGLPGPTEETAG